MYSQSSQSGLAHPTIRSHLEPRLGLRTVRQLDIVRGKCRSLRSLPMRMSTDPNHVATISGGLVLPTPRRWPFRQSLNPSPCLLGRLLDAPGGVVRRLRRRLTRALQGRGRAEPPFGPDDMMLAPTVGRGHLAAGTGRGWYGREVRRQGKRADLNPRTGGCHPDDAPQSWQRRGADLLLPPLSPRHSQPPNTRRATHLSLKGIHPRGRERGSAPPRYLLLRHLSRGKAARHRKGRSRTRRAPRPAWRAMAIERTPPSSRSAKVSASQA